MSDNKIVTVYLVSLNFFICHKNKKMSAMVSRDIKRDKTLFMG